MRVPEILSKKYTQTPMRVPDTLQRILQFFGIIVLVLVCTCSILMIAETIRLGRIYGQDSMPQYLTEPGDIAQVELPYKSVNGNSMDMDLTSLAAPTKRDAASYMQILDNETADYLGYIGDLPLYNLHTGASSRRVSVLIPAFLVMGIILWFCSYKVFKNGKVITDFPASVKEIACGGRLKMQRIL